MIIMTIASVVFFGIIFAINIYAIVTAIKAKKLINKIKQENDL